MFIALHIGLHVNVIFSRLGVARIITGACGAASWLHRMVVATRVVVGLISAYGLYAFVECGLWKYLMLQQPFFFMDLERGYVLFFVDYIAMIAALAAAMHYAVKLLK